MTDATSALAEATRCTRCGNCQAVCPTYGASRIESYAARGRLELVRRFGAGEATAYSDAFFKRLNQCLLCGGCSSNCPAGVRTEQVIESFRSACARQKGPSAPLGLTRDHIAGSGSITGDDPQNRLLWIQNIAAKVAAIKINQPAEYVYLTGCVPALYPSSYSIPQSFVQILLRYGVDFTLSGDAERCCGYPLLIGGLTEEARRAAMQNVVSLRDLGVRKIITTCPSCYHMWHDLYPQLLGESPGFELIHGTQLLEQLVVSGRLPLREIRRTVTFHDPCDLGRKSGIYDAPRRVLGSIPGIEIKEMKHSRADARCCGGGGNLEMSDAALGGRVAQDRVRQALATGAETIITACQQCKRTLGGGARQLRSRIKINDISEIVAEALL